MRKMLLMLALSLTVACGKLSPTGPELAKSDDGLCPVETMACFRFDGTLTTATVTPIKVEGWSQDLPRPGYRNHWRYVLSAPAGEVLKAYQRPTAGITHTVAVIGPNGRGGMWAEVFSPDGTELLWLLTMAPTDDVVAQKFAEVVGAEEFTPQTFQVTVLSDGGAEILISEPEAK